MFLTGFLFYGEIMHEKHRERLRDKAIVNVEALNDHELLELILFSAKPRVNTNDTAHLLLETFGSLGGVFSAPASSLEKVEGVGKTTAAFLVTLGAIMKRCHGELDTAPLKIFSLETIRKSLIETFKKYDSEVLLIYYLNKNQQVTGKSLVGDHVVDMVNVDLQAFCKDVVYNNPSFVVIAHNHTSGDPRPSKNDIATTEKLCYILAVNNVKLLDHVIVSGDKIFSFFHEHVLQGITEKVERSLKSC